ncbi:kinase-like domain-containing protein [Mycena filopes]|nr:kinase-like domain-containing protein [Mycena filopes]KAJ7161693.1 kinase-like domain-containing protein [Mycena filopes]
MTEPHSESGFETSEIRFPDLDPGFYDDKSDTWQKPVSSSEEYVYKGIPHDRILKYFTTRDGYLHLQFHPNGDLWTYLVEKEPPLATRINWAVEIAEGLAHLHSNSVVWADAHFRNILVADDLHVVLADFAYSVVAPSPLHSFTTRPPPVFACPDGYYGRPPTHVDIFGFGVMLFALLANRFPWTVDLLPELDKQVQVMTKHANREFDTVEDAELKRCFGSILEKCFVPQYPTGTELLDEMKQARGIWLQSHHAMITKDLMS